MCVEVSQKVHFVSERMKEILKVCAQSGYHISLRHNQCVLFEMVAGFGHLISGILNIFICAHVWKTSPFSTYSCENWLALYWSRTHHTNMVETKWPHPFRKNANFSLSPSAQYNVVNVFNFSWNNFNTSVPFFAVAVKTTKLIHSLVQTDTHTFVYGKLIFIQQHQ